MSEDGVGRCLASQMNRAFSVFASGSLGGNRSMAAPWPRKLSMLVVLVRLLPLCFAIPGAEREDAFVGYSERLSQDSTGGTVAGNVLLLETTLGAIRVTLRPDAAPQAVAQIKEWVKQGLYDGCDIYRAEPPGETRDDGKPGTRPGYALVQGGMYSCGRQKEHSLPVEPALKITTWSLSLISATSEFFFSMEPHPEWDGSFSVVGQVEEDESRSLLEIIVSLPTRQEGHPSGTVLRILKEPVVFQAKLV